MPLNPTDLDDQADLAKLPSAPPEAFLGPENRDFNDVFRQEGSEAIREAMGRATDPREGAVAFAALDLTSLSKERPTAKQFAISQLAPAAEMTLFTGPGSSGKSLLGQQMATAAAAGMPCLKFDLRPAPAIYLTCEDDADHLHFRQAHICEELGVGMAKLAGRLHLISLRGELDNELCTFASDGRILPTQAYRRLAKTVADTGAKHVWLDNLSHLYTGNENDRGQVTRFVNLLNRLAGETGAAIILLGHPPKPRKPGDQVSDHSGSTAWLNAVRSQFNVKHDLETDIRTISVGKANYGRKGEASRFIWRDWAFVHEDDLPPDQARELAETAQASTDNRLFLDCLRERHKQRRAVSEKRSSTFAPTEFAKMAESRGIGKERLEKAMDRLFRLNVIERGFLWVHKGERKPVHGIRECAGDGADNTTRATRETVPKTAVNGAGDAGDTLSIPTVLRAGPSEAAPPNEEEREDAEGEVG